MSTKSKNCKAPAARVASACWGFGTRLLKQDYSHRVSRRRAQSLWVRTMRFKTWDVLDLPSPIQCLTPQSTSTYSCNLDGRMRCGIGKRATPPAGPRDAHLDHHIDRRLPHLRHHPHVSPAAATSAATAACANSATLLRFRLRSHLRRPRLRHFCYSPPPLLCLKCSRSAATPRIPAQQQLYCSNAIGHPTATNGNQR